MIIRRSECFDADLEQQFRWYLLETGLDPIPLLNWPKSLPNLSLEHWTACGRIRK